MKNKQQQRLRRKLRIRAKVSGTKARPRLSVFRSNTALYVQLIDDTKGVTIFSTMTRGVNKKAATDLGAQVAHALKKKGITTAVFDRNGYRYHGVMKSLADAAREGGLQL